MKWIARWWTYAETQADPVTYRTADFLVTYDPSIGDGVRIYAYKSRDGDPLHYWTYRDNTEAHPLLRPLLDIARNAPRRKEDGVPKPLVLQPIRGVKRFSRTFRSLLRVAKAVGQQEEMLIALCGGLIDQFEFEVRDRRKYERG